MIEIVANGCGKEDKVVYGVEIFSSLCVLDQEICNMCDASGMSPIMKRNVLISKFQNDTK